MSIAAAEGVSLQNMDLTNCLQMSEMGDWWEQMEHFCLDLLIWERLLIPLCGPWIPLYLSAHFDLDHFLLFNRPSVSREQLAQLNQLNMTQATQHESNNSSKTMQDTQHMSERAHQALVTTDGRSGAFSMDPAGRGQKSAGWGQKAHKLTDPKIFDKSA